MSRRPKFARSLQLEALESREVLSAGGPSAEAQYMLHLINQARTNPQATAERVTSNLDADVQATVNYYSVDLGQVKNAITSSAPRPPVAWNGTLAATATRQSQDQANTGVQSHYGADGSTLGQRLDRAGYTNRASDGENAFAYANSVDNAMEAFLIDWGVSSLGHRNNLLQPNATPDQYYKEVGIGIVNSNRPNFGPEVITQDFATRAGARAQVLGVAYNDPAHLNTYTLGSGAGNVQIDATNLATGQTQSTQTWDAGGYQMALDPGTYQVTARVGSQVVRSQQVSIGDQNVEVDFDLSNPWQGSAPVATVSVAPKAAAMTTAPANTSAAPTNAAVLSSASWSRSWSAWTARTS